MQSGLSGAVLLVSPDIGASAVVKDIELPRLLALEAGGAFALSVASTIEAEAGRLDYGAPDRLLSQPSSTLKRLRQDAALTSKEIADIARSHCRQRMEALRQDIESAGQVIDINLQTRITPSANSLNGDLVVRLRPPMPGDRRPNRLGLQDLQLFLGEIPYLQATAGRGTHSSTGVCCCSAIRSVLTAKRKCPHYGECDIDAARAGKTSDTQQLTRRVYDNGAGSDVDGSEHTSHQAHTGGLQRGWSSRTSSRQSRSQTCQRYTERIGDRCNTSGAQPIRRSQPYTPERVAEGAGGHRHRS